MSMESVSDTLLIGFTQPTHNQPYLVSLATIIYRRGEARCEMGKAREVPFVLFTPQTGAYDIPTTSVLARRRLAY